MHPEGHFCPKDTDALVFGILVFVFDFLHKYYDYSELTARRHDDIDVGKSDQSISWLETLTLASASNMSISKLVPAFLWEYLSFSSSLSP